MTKRKLLNLCLGIGVIMGVLTGCASKISTDETNDKVQHQETNDNVQSKSTKFNEPGDENVNTSSPAYEVNPETFTLEVKKGKETVVVSQPGEQRLVENFTQEKGVTSWLYPKEKIAVTITPAEDYLEVSVRSEEEMDNEFNWPVISGDMYYLPLGEGKRVPKDDPVWNNYLKGTSVSVMEQLSMPFWAAAQGENAVVTVLENPYRSELMFSETSENIFTLKHEYPEIDPEKEQRFRFYLTENDPVAAAKIYRSYVMEKGQFVTLKEKEAQNPDIQKLYGAPHIYLWGELIISSEDVNWQAFRGSIDSSVMEWLKTRIAQLESGDEAINALDEIKSQDYVGEYQKDIVCRALSEILKHDDFYQEEALHIQDPFMQSCIKKGLDNLSESEQLQFHKHALAANLPEVFLEVDNWMNQETVNLVRELKENGIDHAWIGLNNWEQAYAKPELVATAVSKDYLIGPYDSYHSIHKPGEEQWITAAFQDTSLYENAVIEDKNGEKITGFQNVGRKLNPTLSIPAVEHRLQSIEGNGVGFNSWFIDCDATGEIYDDYTPEHLTTQQEDLQARLERMSLIRDSNKVIGSEGGSDFAASTIAFAHGIELQSFSWMDEDMKNNKDSEYYIGKYYNPKGGAAERFTRQVPVKEQYAQIFLNPKYDVPLYKLVYNDSVITTYHWDWSTFKIKDKVEDRMLREVLYNVPPLYHLDSTEWEKYKTAITSHTAAWSQFSKEAVQEEMTDFEYLTDDGLVQMTNYGEQLTAVANFTDADFQYENQNIPAHSVLMEQNGNSVIYTPEAG